MDGLREDTDTKEEEGREEGEEGAAAEVDGVAMVARVFVAEVIVRCCCWDRDEDAESVDKDRVGSAPK